MLFPADMKGIFPFKIRDERNERRTLLSIKETSTFVTREESARESRERKRIKDDAAR